MAMHSIKILFAISLCIGCLPKASVSCKITKSHDCLARTWSKWSSCSKSCGTGTMHRTAIKVLRPDGPGSTSYIKGSEETCYMPEEWKTCKYRDCYTPPRPISCSWASWGQWSSCTMIDGHGSRSRARNVGTPAFYDGRRCSGKEYQIDYRCSGYNIKEDNSETGTCSDPPNLTCEANYPVIPNIDITATGYNIKKDTTAGFVLNNDNFCGHCNVAYLGDFRKYYRMPYNIQSFRSSTNVRSALQVKYFKSIMELSEAKNEEIENKVSFGLFAHSNDGGTAGFFIGGADSKKWKEMIETSTSEDSVYYAVTFRVELGQFHMETNLTLDSEFRNRIAQLPLHYDYAKYAAFFTDFGTHYYTEGKLGGTFELIFEYSRLKVNEFRLSEKEQKNCLVFGISAAYKGSGITISGHAGCPIRGSGTSQNSSFINSAMRSNSVARGGSSTTAIVLTISGHKTTPEEYRVWSDSIRHNPAIIDYKLAPISNLVENHSRKTNLERTLRALSEAYDPRNCRGRTCRNGGRFVVIDHGKECVCVCPPGYYGVECGYRS